MPCDVTLDSQHKMAYIGLREHEKGIVAESLPLADFAAEAGIETLHDLILDFDANGRLIGIEVMNAKKALPDGLLAEAKRI
jgi:uncharacterized protein YuzE